MLSAVRRQSFEDRENEQAKPLSLAKGSGVSTCARFSPCSSAVGGVLVCARRSNGSKSAAGDSSAYRDVAVVAADIGFITLVSATCNRAVGRGLDDNWVLVLRDTTCSPNTTDSSKLRRWPQQTASRACDASTRTAASTKQLRPRS
jgi:hypothetical protein